uniref:Long intergenic non-protein coding RNA 3040 n=1 Tax=Saimiri boliviensis boliviensis TaxID=39432 RepID=A0A2K6U2E0_SAIBB
MMPLAEAGALAQGGGPSATEWACILPRLLRREGADGGFFSPEDPQAQAAHLADGQSIQKKCRKRECFWQKEQLKQRLDSGIWCLQFEGGERTPPPPQT